MIIGTEDPVIPIERAWVARMQQAGRDVGMIEYAGAGHACDDTRHPVVRWTPIPLNPFRCEFFEQPDGRVLDAEGPPATQDHPCWSRGYPRGYDPRSHLQMIEDVRVFLTKVFAKEP